MKRKYGLILLLGALAFLTYHALTEDRFGWDLTVTRWIQTVDAETLGFIPDFLFWMGYKAEVGIGVAAMLMVVAVVWLWFKSRRAEAFFLALIIAPDCFNFYLRSFIGSPRPTSDLVIVYGESQGASFPSGTALHYTLFCGFILYLSCSLIKPGALRSAFWVVLGLFIPVVGVWLVYDGRHWPRDVLGGYVYGAFYLVVLIWGYRKYIAWRRRYPRDHIPTEKLPTVARPLAWIVRTIT